MFRNHQTAPLGAASAAAPSTTEGLPVYAVLRGEPDRPTKATPTPSPEAPVSLESFGRAPSGCFPMHPLPLSGAPLCCEVDFIEVRHQKQPLLAFCVLERAALRAGIVLRLETCPQECGPSWLALQGIGRIFVERVDGLVRVSISAGNGAGTLRLGGEDGTSVLIDTGAQVCLIGGQARMQTPRRVPYDGPTLRGANDSVVTCVPFHAVLHSALLRLRY